MPQPRSNAGSSGGSSGSSSRSSGSSGAKRTSSRSSSAKSSSGSTAKRSTAKRSTAKRSTGTSAKRATSSAKRTTSSGAKRATSSGASRARSAASSAGSTAQAGEQRLEAVATRIRKLNDRIIDAGKEAGETTLSAYEKALKTLASSMERGAGRSDVEWVSQLLNTQAKFIRDVTSTWTSVARDALK